MVKCGRWPLSSMHATCAHAPTVTLLCARTDGAVLQAQEREERSHKGAKSAADGAAWHRLVPARAYRCRAHALLLPKREGRHGRGSQDSCGHGVAAGVHGREGRF